MTVAALQLWAALGEALIALRARRRRALLSAIGIALAAAMLSAALVITDGLGDGFDRAVRAADLGDLIVRFDPQLQRQAQRRIESLPDLAGYALRTELTNVAVTYGSHQTGSAVAEVVGAGRRQGYPIVAGHNLQGAAREVLVEPGLAAAWHIRLGSELYVRGLGPERVAGFAEGPDDVGYPLAAARLYITRAAVNAADPALLVNAPLLRDPGFLTTVRHVNTPVRSIKVFHGRSGVFHFTRIAGNATPVTGADRDPLVNFAEIWLRNPRYLNEVLVQARAQSYGLRDVQFATRGGVRVLVGQAAGIVIDLLVALSVIALATAAVMLAASSRAEVQRRMRSIGIRRAVGATRGHVALTQALETALVAVPAATIGTLAGLWATHSPGDRLLALLNEPGPGAALLAPVLASWLASFAIPVAGAAWPAWSAAGRAVITLLRGADVTRARSSGSVRPRRLRGRTHSGTGGRGGGLTGLGARLVTARPARLAATTTMLAGSTAFVLLMIALASTLSSLETDPQELGKHYQLTDSLAPSRAPLVARIPGVQAAEPRYELHAADAYSLGEIVDVIAYPRDHTLFEAPPLASGKRLQGDDEAEVGVGLADALGLAPGSQLLLALPSGQQLSLRVAGTVSSLDDEGLVAYVPAAALLAADPQAPSQIAVLLKPGADQAAVVSALSRLGAAPATASGATARGAPLVAILKVILRALAIVDGLVCIYALAQACSLTLQERRGTVAVLRACGAGAGAVRRLLAGAVLALLVPAAIIGIVLERLILGPALAHLAASYATLDLSPSAPEVLAVVAGLVLAGVVAVWWTARSAMRESVVTGLAA